MLDNNKCDRCLGRSISTFLNCKVLKHWISCAFNSLEHQTKVDASETFRNWTAEFCIQTLCKLFWCSSAMKINTSHECVSVRCFLFFSHYDPRACWDDNIFFNLWPSHPPWWRISFPVTPCFLHFSVVWIIHLLFFLNCPHLPSSIEDSSYSTTQIHIRQRCWKWI